jgi:hypothetical protein
MHPILFAMHHGDLVEDAKLRCRIASLQWVDYKHLGVPSVDTALLRLAVEELMRMDAYKAPRDKLVCILNACKVINGVLQRMAEEQSERARLSADDFLPLLIFCCIRANPPRLASNLEFIAAFRHPSRLILEDDYFLTALQSAVAFINDAQAKQFDVSPEEYDQCCEEALADFEDREESAMAAVYTRHVEPDWQETANVAEVKTLAEKAAALRVDKREWLRGRLEQLPFRFEVVKSGRQIRLGQLPALLAEYGELAALLRGLQDDEAHEAELFN